MSTGRERSATWDYFAVKGDDKTKAVCNVCKNEISRGKQESSFSTSSMMKHLKLKHNIDARDKRSLSESSRQLTLNEIAAKRKHFNPNDDKSKKITKLIGEMIAVDYLPISTVENDGFKRLMAEVEPRYDIPARKQFSTKILPEMQEKVKDKINDLLSKCNGKLSATTDIWTSQQNVPYLSLTGKAIVRDKNNNFAHFSPILACRELPGTHSGENILLAISDLEQEWNVVLKFIVTDNASNMGKAFEESNIINIKCMAHTLNLVVQNALKTGQRTVIDAVAKCRKIAGHYHRSAIHNEQLRKYQQDHNMPVHKLIQDIVTRWNSTFYMIERLIEQKEAINYLSMNHGVGQTLSFNEWRICDSVCKVLRCFEVATKELSDECASLSYVLPIVHNLNKKLNNFLVDIGQGNLYGVGSFVEMLREEMSLRFNPKQHSATAKQVFFYSDAIYMECIVATLLDPRFKDFGDEQERSFFIQKLENATLAWTSNDDDAEVHNSSSSSENNNDSVLFGSAANIESESDISQAITENREQRAKIQIMQYLALPKLRRKKNPLEFWEENKERFPLLFDMALTYLACPPTSVDSERFFSATGIVDRPLRNRLKPKNLEMLTFLHVNLKRLDFKY